MKNPFKGIGGRMRAVLGKLKMPEDKKAEFQKSVVDNFGDGCFIGGLTLLGAALFTPVAVAPTLAAAGLIISAGAAAKYTAGKMKPNGPTLEKAIPSEIAAPSPAPVAKVKPLGPFFARARDAASAKEAKRLSKFTPPPPRA